MMDKIRYYGVHILKDSGGIDQNLNEKVHVYSNYEEAHKVIKEHKNARFKCFTTKEEALSFALHGSISGPGNPSVSCETIYFKSLKRQEIYQFRKHIELNDLNSVKKLVLENPRYLIGIGDTPTIMQEGARYNALHIAAKHNRSEIADFILKTVGNKTFCQHLYGAAGDNSYLIRPEVMLDLYLNTPDKALNETPLHFAAKYGAHDVIMVFVQYPQLQLQVKNKYGQTPKDVTCKMASGMNISPNDIHKLLDELFFVPVWRSEDDIIQPIVGKPFSPKSPPVCPLATSPLSPNMEIKAIAGPMNFTEAENFHRSWKSPAKSVSCSTPHINRGILLRSPLNSVKGLENVGRSLAKKFHVSWKEYWPFLDRFIDLSSEEGLQLLDDYLKQKIVRFNNQSSVLPEEDSFASPMSELCYAFSKFSINSPVHHSKDNYNPKIFERKEIEPFLFVEKWAVVFAKNIVDVFIENFSHDLPIEDNVVSLIKKMRNLSVPIFACRKDKYLRNFPFNKIHSRIALWITRNLGEIKDRCLGYAIDTFRLVQAMNTTEVVHCISLSPSSVNIRIGDVIRVLKCVNDKIVKLLEGEIIFEKIPPNENKCEEEWLSMKICRCYEELENNREPSFDREFSLKFRKLESSVSRKINFTFDENDNDDVSPNTGESLYVFKKNSDFEVTNSSANCVSNSCDSSSDSSESENEFHSMPNSPSTSDDEWGSADEGPEIFIFNNKGSSMDNAVLEAISDAHIDAEKYPFIYQWKHFISLHNIQRLNWPSPNVTPYKQMKLKRLNF